MTKALRVRRYFTLFRSQEDSREGRQGKIGVIWDPKAKAIEGLRKKIEWGSERFQEGFKVVSEGFVGRAGPFKKISRAFQRA